jgi:hypothetical protein
MRKVHKSMAERERERGRERERERENKRDIINQYILSLMAD